MTDLLDYLPGTADNLLFLTLAVLVLLMITGVYGYLNVTTHGTANEPGRLRWGWPALSLFALAVLFFWFGRPLAAETGTPLERWLILLSQFITGFLVIAFGAAAVFCSDLKWALAAATLSFLTSGLLLVQAELLPLVLLCWLMLGTMVLLFLSRGVYLSFADSEEAGPFREPFLSCLVCGFLLCSTLWIVHREWGGSAQESAATAETVAPPDTLLLVQQFLHDHWSTLILLLVFVAVAYVGITRLQSEPPAAPFTDDFEGSTHS